MKPSMPLRRRFTLLATVMGLLLSTLSAATISFVAEDYEVDFADRFLPSDLTPLGRRQMGYDL